MSEESEGIPGFVQILNERNPSLVEVVEEGRRLEEEMWQVRKAQRQVFFQPLPVARRGVA